MGLLGGGSSEKRWHAAAAPVTRSGQETTESADWGGQIVLALRHTVCERSSDRASAAAAAARAHRSCAGGAVNGDDAREAVMMCACARVTRGARDARGVRCSRPPTPTAITNATPRARDRPSERAPPPPPRALDGPSIAPGERDSLPACACAHAGARARVCLWDAQRADLARSAAASARAAAASSRRCPRRVAR